MALRVRRKERASWRGTVGAGAGSIGLGSGAFTGPYSLRSRVGDEAHTSPEELIGAANAACFAMSLANLLADAGFEVRDVTADATVTLEETPTGFSVTGILLQVEGDAPGVDADTFARLAEQAKSTCPISRALAGTEITLEARLAETGSAW